MIRGVGGDLFWEGIGILFVFSILWKAEFAFGEYKDGLCFLEDEKGEV